jgi:hypothetical protein
MSKVNNFDVLKIMGDRNLKIKSAGLDNITSAKKWKNGLGKVEIVVDEETIIDLVTGSLVGMFVVADKEQFKQVNQDIRDVDNNENRIVEAIKLLRENGYIVKKFTKEMELDSDKCESSNGNKDCMGCACSVCIVQ